MIDTFCSGAIGWDEDLLRAWVYGCIVRAHDELERRPPCHYEEVVTLWDAVPVPRRFFLGRGPQPHDLFHVQAVFTIAAWGLPGSARQTWRWSYRIDRRQFEDVLRNVVAAVRERGGVLE